MKKKLLLISVALGLGCLFLLTGCSSDNNVEKEAEYQNEIMDQASSEIGMPEITEFYEKKMAKEIFELRDDSSLICYAYAQSDVSGKFVYLGKCMGYGLPYSTQYTNPEARVWYNGSSAILPQADPNGLYSGDGLSSTWVMLIDETTGERSVMYIESTLTVTQTKLPARLVESFSLTSDY